MLALNYEGLVVRPQSAQVGLEQSDFQQQGFGGLRVPYQELRVVRPRPIKG